MIQLSTLAGPGIPTMPPQGSPFSGASGFAIALADLVGAAIEPIAGERQPLADGGMILPGAVAVPTADPSAGAAATPPIGDPLAVVALMTGAADTIVAPRADRKASPKPAAEDPLAFVASTTGMADTVQAPIPGLGSPSTPVVAPPGAETIVVAAPAAAANTATAPVKPRGSAKLPPLPAASVSLPETAEPSLKPEGPEAGDIPTDPPARSPRRKAATVAPSPETMIAVSTPVAVPASEPNTAGGAPHATVSEVSTDTSPTPIPGRLAQSVPRGAPADVDLGAGASRLRAEVQPLAPDMVLPTVPVSTTDAVRPGAQSDAPPLPTTPMITALAGATTVSTGRVEAAPPPFAAVPVAASSAAPATTAGQPTVRSAPVSPEPGAPTAQPRGILSAKVPDVMAATLGPRPARFAAPSSSPPLTPRVDTIPLAPNAATSLPPVAIDVRAQAPAPSSTVIELPLTRPSLPTSTAAPSAPVGVPDVAQVRVPGLSVGHTPAAPGLLQPEARAPIAGIVSSAPVAAPAGVPPAPVPVPDAAAAPDVTLPILQPREQRMERPPVTVTVAAPAPSALPVQPASQPAAQAFAAAMFAATERPERDRREPADPLPAITALSATATAGAPAPVAVTAPTAPLDLTRADWMQTMIDHIETLQGEGNRTETRLRLSPDALGSVDVTIRQDADGAMRIQVTAESPHARAILADAAPRLAEMAESRGLRMGGGGADAQAGAQQGQRDTPRAAPAAPGRPASAAETRDDTKSTDSRIA